MDQSERVSVTRTEVMFVIVGEKLRFVGSHVHMDGTLSFATFTGETEIQGFFHPFAPPPVLQRVTLKHFKKPPRPSPGRVHLLPGNHVAGTHGSPLFAAAFPHSNTAFHGAAKAEAVARELEMSCWLERIIM